MHDRSSEVATTIDHNGHEGHKGFIDEADDIGCALIPANDGRRFTACSNPNAGSFYVPGTLMSCTPPMPMSRIAQMLTREAGRPVVDKTGLAGGQAFELHWLPEGAQPQLDSPPSLFTAIREQLGLKLDPQRGAVDSIVIDHAERPSAN